jgi:molybdopterin-guanine dinucleotide biosynthesis protein A
MNTEYADVTAILLAGGSSSRMGTEKGLVLLNGKPLLEYAVETLQSVFDKIIISSNSKAFNGYGWPVIADEFPDCGPLSGIYTGMKSMQTNFAFVLSYDMPFVKPELIRMILDFRHDYEVVLPVYQDFPVPVCAVYHRSILPQMESNLRTKKLKLIRFVNEQKHHLLKLDSDIENQLFSLNTQQDLHHAAAIQNKKIIY